MIEDIEKTTVVVTEHTIHSHYCPACKWLHESEVNDGVCAKCGAAVQSEMTKVSKTKLNTIDPDAILDHTLVWCVEVDRISAKEHLAKAEDA